jgi:hypothetical protein
MSFPYGEFLVKAGLFVALYSQFQEEIAATLIPQPTLTLLVGICFPVYSVCLFQIGFLQHVVGGSMTVETRWGWGG